MRKRFNVTGTCYPDKHYMVRLEDRLEQIKNMVDEGDYFVMNRARQYGKTTLLYALRKYLRGDYIVLSMSFQGMSAASFESEAVFSKTFLGELLSKIENPNMKIEGLPEEVLSQIRGLVDDREVSVNLPLVFQLLSELCEGAGKPVVLLIDEVDSASNNQVFLDFLGLLRDYYLGREERAAFQSVILAGVYDIKNLKQKIRPDKEHKYNSPWNISADFDVDLSFSAVDIAGMLAEYEADYQTGMKLTEISELIYAYTSGYPYLVSRICRLTHDRAGKEGQALEQLWTREGILASVKALQEESNTLFDDMRKKVTEDEQLRDMLYAILFYGQYIPFNINNRVIDMGTMFGFIKKEDGRVAIANRIFETVLYNLFLSEEVVNSITYKAAVQDRNQFLTDGNLNMDMVLEKFTEHFTDVYADSDTKFIEENGRRLFLLYLKPIINGSGNYYIESRTRDMGRTDIIVDYKGRQYIIEMKIWRGNEYNQRGEKQLAEYLSAYHIKKGYMVSFNFNKNKKTGVHTVSCGDKIIVEAVV